MEIYICIGTLLKCRFNGGKFEMRPKIDFSQLAEFKVISSDCSKFISNDPSHCCLVTSALDSRINKIASFHSPLSVGQWSTFYKFYVAFSIYQFQIPKCLLGCIIMMCINFEFDSQLGFS